MKESEHRAFEEEIDKVNISSGGHLAEDRHFRPAVKRALLYYGQLYREHLMTPYRQPRREGGSVELATQEDMQRQEDLMFLREAFVALGQERAVDEVRAIVLREYRRFRQRH